MAFQISVKNSIFILVALGLASLAALAVLQIMPVRGDVMADRESQVRQLVEVAHSIVEDYRDAVDRGEMDAETARKLAVASISAMRFDGANYFWITNSEAFLIYHPRPEQNQTNQGAFADAKGTRIYVRMAEIAAESGQGYLTYYFPKLGETKAQPKLSFIKQVEGWNWIIGTGFYVDDVDERVGAMRMRAAIGVGVVSVVLLFVSFLVGRFLLGRIDRLSSAMSAIADGNLDAEIRGTKATDNIGVMARALLLFRDNAKAKLELEEAARREAAQAKAREEAQLKAERETEEARLRAEHAAREQAEEERRVTQETVAQQFDTTIAGIIDDIAAVAGQVEADAASLLEQSTEGSAATSQIAGISRRSAEQITSLASATQQLSASLGEVSSSSEASHTATREAVERSEATTKEVEGLDTATSQIGEVVNLISDIAEQTNLLALNATIEAARAGDAGKGFAVVASEVKALASQTAKATDDIRAKMEEMQAASRSAVGAVDLIRSTLDGIDHSMGTIASAVTEQDKATAEIAESIASVSSGTEEVAQAAGKLNERSEAERQSAERLSDTARKLSGMGDNLRQSADEFLKALTA